MTSYEQQSLGRERKIIEKSKKSKKKKKTKRQKNVIIVYKSLYMCACVGKYLYIIVCGRISDI